MSTKRLARLSIAAILAITGYLLSVDVAPRPAAVFVAVLTGAWAWVITGIWRRGDRSARGTAGPTPTRGTAGPTPTREIPRPRAPHTPDGRPATQARRSRGAPMNPFGPR